MLTAQQRLKIKAHLYRIENEIYAAMQTDSAGPYWLVPHYPNMADDHYITKQSQQIFNGDGGIALFYMMLYQLDKKEKHLDTAKRIVNRLLNSDLSRNPELFYFYSGLPDLIYLSIKLFELTKEDSYRRKAIELTLLNHSDIIAKTSKFDLLNGHAGNLLVLTLVYHYHPTEEILSIIHQLLDRFILEARISQVGLKWNHNKWAFDSPTGFSHGGAGIGYALIAVGKYLNYPGIVYLGEQAFSYEMQYLDENALNWIDLRVGPAQLRLKEAHNWDMSTLLSSPSDVNAWAYGAAGIGLAHISAYQVTGEELFFKYCPMVAERCKRDLAKKREDYTLGSGYSGMIPFLLKYQRVSADEQMTTTVLTIIDQAMELYTSKGSYNSFINCNAIDTGLFSGKSGVGLMLVQLLSGDDEAGDIACPLLPKSPQVYPDNRNYAKPAVQYQLFKRYFPRTIAKFESYGRGLDASQSYRDIDEFCDALGLALDLLQGNEAEQIIPIYHLEVAKTELWKMHRGALCFTKRKDFLNGLCSEMMGMDKIAFLKHTFMLSKYARLHYPKSDVIEPLEDSTKFRTSPVLLICDEFDIKEIPIGRLVEVILNLLKEPTTGTEIYRHVTDYMDESEHLFDTLNIQTVDQLIQLICGGIVEIYNEGQIQ